MSVWTQTHTYTPIPEQSLGIGTAVDISENHFIYAVLKKKEVHYQNLAAAGYSTVYADVVHGISLDPVADDPYVIAGSSLFHSPNGSSASEVRKLSVDIVYTLPSILSAYNGKIVAGFPIGQNLDNLIAGAVYFYQ